MESEQSSHYRNLVPSIDVHRNADFIDYFSFEGAINESRFEGFLNDINCNNDAIELSLIKNKAYREAVIIWLNIAGSKDDTDDMLKNIVKGEQKTFSGSKLFYINDKFNKILVMAVPNSMNGKVNMVINRLNKVNDRVYRVNTKIKRDNIEMYMKRKTANDKKDSIIDLINRNLKA